MADRRKIVIPTGVTPDEPLPAPHFDAEATMTARPVVPLSDQEIHHSRYAPAAGGGANSFWKRPALLALVALVAIGVGVAAGFAIGLYRNRNAAQTSPAASPTPFVEKADIGQTIEPPVTSPPEVRTPVAETAEQPSVEPEEQAKPRKREDSRSEERPKQPAAARDRERESTDDDDRIAGEREERQIDREQRRAERRERRQRQREEDGVPRQIDRAGRELDRIREIFEGRQP